MDEPGSIEEAKLFTGTRKSEERQDTRNVRDSIHLHGNCRPGERYLPTVTRTRGLRTSPVFYIARDRALLTYMSLFEHVAPNTYRNLEDLFDLFPLLSLSFSRRKK